LGSAQKNFNHISKKFSHSMDHGLISTIDLIFLNFYPKKIWSSFELKKITTQIIFWLL
jgi:hypothetical protein